MNTAFLTKLASAETKVVTKGGAGSRSSSHIGDAYINKQGRLFGVSNKHNTYYDIENGTVEGTIFIKVRLAKQVGTDKQTGKPTYGKTALQTSAPSTGTPFITVTKLCKELFGKNEEDWARDFQFQGDQDGFAYYTLMETVEATESDKKETKKETSKPTAKK